MKKIRILPIILLLVLSAFMFVSCEKEALPVAGFENPSLEIAIENDKAVIKGSFDNPSAIEGEYVLDFTIVKDGDEEGAISRTKKYSLSAGRNEFLFEIGLYSANQTVRAGVSFEGESICDVTERNIKSFRILSIGNSFSVDAQQWLYGIAKDMGYDNVILGNLYYGGCSLYGHCNFYQNKKEEYTYYKNTTGTWEETRGVSLLHGLCDERWDYITLQQASGASGDSSTYFPFLNDLKKIVDANKTNPIAEILWHMTWAYSSDSTHQDFAKYENDQMKMYNAIVGAVNEKVVTTSGIADVIPAGTAIQNARNTSLGDTLCRDGFHLELGYGRYLAGLTWIHKITGESIDEVTYIPDNMFDEATLEILKDCAKKAVANPFEVAE